MLKTRKEADDSKKYASMKAFGNREERSRHFVTCVERQIHIKEIDSTVCYLAHYVAKNRRAILASAKPHLVTT